MRRETSRDFVCVRVKLSRQPIHYDIAIGTGAIASLGAKMRKCLGGSSRRACVISNRKVFRLFSDTVTTSLRASNFEARSWLIGDGERYKSLDTLSRTISFLASQRLERNDVVVALGGGVVGDLAGFAAACYLRGIPLIQVPTTLLSQIDSSVGGKTGVNLPAGKNLVGAFHQPRLVVIDPSTLRTLPKRELVAGFCEAVKHGAVGDRRLFFRTLSFLEKGIDFNDQDKLHDFSQLIADQCTFKARVVARDEREDVLRDDHRSRRILNFGHTIGHALESVTNYRRFKHGEAVGHGMIVAAEISNRLGLLRSSELELLRSAVRKCGRLPSARDVSEGAILRAISRDKKSVEGRIKWVLLERLGRARIVDEAEIPDETLLDSLRTILRPSQES